MGASEPLSVTLSRGVSLAGKTWWALALGPRLAVLLLAGFGLFGDEQERFVCNTIQPGCSNACFDAFAPVSVLRLWLLHLLLLCLPHLLFATYVAHEVLAGPGASGSSLQRPREAGGRGFHSAYVLVVLARTLVEAVFGAGQLYLFGPSLPKSVLCYEAPCTSGVECYVSRRTEKSLMLVFMLGVASLSVLLSLFDLTCSVKAAARGRGEGPIKGDQSSTFTATTMAEEGEDPEADGPPTSVRPWVPNGPPPSPRPDSRPSPTPRSSAAVGGRDPGQRGPAGRNSGDSPDRRAWV